MMMDALSQCRDVVRLYVVQLYVVRLYVVRLMILQSDREAEVQALRQQRDLLKKMLDQQKTVSVTFDHRYHNE